MTKVSNILCTTCLILCVIACGLSIYGLTFPRCKKNICKYNSIPQCCENFASNSCHDYEEYNLFTTCYDINQKCNEFKCKLIYNNITTFGDYYESDEIFAIPGGMINWVFAVTYIIFSPFVIALIIFAWCKN